MPHALSGKGLSVDPCVACCQEASVAGAAADGIGEHTGCPVCASVHARGQEHLAGEAARRGLTASAPQAHRHVTSHLLSTGQNITSQSDSTRLANVRVLSLIYVRHTVHNLESHDVRAVRLQTICSQKLGNLSMRKWIIDSFVVSSLCEWTLMTGGRDAADREPGPVVSHVVPGLQNSGRRLEAQAGAAHPPRIPPRQLLLAEPAQSHPPLAIWQYPNLIAPHCLPAPRI